MAPLDLGVLPGRDGLRGRSSAGEAWRPETVGGPWLGKGRSVCQFAGVAVNTHGALGGLNDKNLFPHDSGS